MVEFPKTLINKIGNRLNQLGPGTKTFLKSLSWVTLYFVASKVFSSVTTVIVARYLGALNFGEAQIILLLAQLLSLLMIFGMHTAIMRYSAAKESPEPIITSGIYITLIITATCLFLLWIFQAPLIRWFDLNVNKLVWVSFIGFLFCFYLIFTSIYQALGFFKQRGKIEVLFAVLMLPGLLIGHFITTESYKALLVAYSLAYATSLLPMIWRFRGLLKSRTIIIPETREMLSYGGLSCIANIGYILTFIIQPIQLQQYQDTEQVGIFRLYCYGSINMAAFATSIIATVFFPKMSASTNRLGIWRILDKMWLKLSLPMFAAFCILGSIIVMLAGSDFPLIWTHIILFSIASSLITIQSTYAQIMASQGVRGMRWGLLLSILSGVTNLGLSAILIPILATTGAVLVLIINYGVTLIGTFLVRDVVLTDKVLEPSAPHKD